MNLKKEENKNTKKKLVYIHGFASNKDSNKALIDYCKKENITFWSKNLPGHGNEPFSNEKLTIQNFSDIIIDFINKNKIKKFFIVGHSMGAAIAINVADWFKEDVEKIILISPLNVSIKNNSWNEIKDDLIDYLEQRNITKNKEKIRITPIDILKFSLLAKNISNKSNLIQTDKKYRNIQNKTLILLGEHDFILPYKKCYEYFYKMNKTNFVIKQIKNANHSLYKTQPKLFIDEVDAFLKEK